MLRNPPRFFYFMNIKIGNVRFDVQDRCSIKIVHILYMKDVSIHPVQLYNRYTDPVGSAWGPGAENTMGFVIQKRSDYEGVPPGEMKMIDQKDVGKAVKIL